MFVPASNADALPRPSGVVRLGPNGPFVGQVSVPGAYMQPVAVSVLNGVIPPLAVATQSVVASLMESLFGFRPNET